MSQNKRDNYHIISLIGQGAYGQVYKGRRKYTGQLVAIKTIKKKGKQQKDINSMRQQIDILKKLKHQNIVLLLDSFQTNSQFVIVTQLGQGQLFNIIQDDQFLPEPQIRKISQQLVRALHYLHSNRITHRDMKPQNILISSNGVIKLCDFGFARHMSYNTQVLTSIKGTPLYMSPEVVQQLPYTHTADLWSLGVILYELATGAPPFTASNIYGLIDKIVKDTIKYPQTLSTQFKNFLKGLLNKNPTQRLGWPQLLNHAFIRQTQAQKLQRKKRLEKYNQWIGGENAINPAKEQSMMNVTTSYRSASNVGFQQKRDISPRKTICMDDIWNKYQITAVQQKGATQLRSDTTFLDKLLTLLSTNFNEILRNKQKKGIIQCGLKVLTLIMIKTKSPQNKKIDIIKNVNIPNYILNMLKNILKIDNGKTHIEFISEIVKTIGLLAKSTFDKNIGIQMVYLRSFIPLLPLISKSSLLGEEQIHINLIANLVKTIGIFANNASANHIRSFNFYKDLVQVKFIQDCVTFLKHLQNNTKTIKFIIQVFSVLMHPVEGDISTFPWKRSCSTYVNEFNECSGMFECVRQNIMNCLLEIDWISLFIKIYQIQEQNQNITRISILRILLQSIRQSKEFTQHIINSKQLMKLLFSLLSVPQPLIYATNSLIVAQILKYHKQKKKQKLIQATLNQYVPIVLQNLEKLSEHKSLLIAMSSLTILQQVLQNDMWCYQLILNKFQQANYWKVIFDLLSNPQNNKIEEMRKIEGSNYGCHIIGFFDSTVTFIHRLLIRYNKQYHKMTDICKILQQNKIDEKIYQILITLSPKTDLSPRGFITVLMFVHDLIGEYKNFSTKFFDENCLKSLISLLRQPQLVSIQEWPVNLFGGGVTCLQLLSANLMKIFILGLQSEKEVDKIKKLYLSNELIKLTIGSTQYLNKQHVNSPITFLCRIIYQDEEKDNTYSKQFVQQNGLDLYRKFNLLGSDSSTPLILESLSLLSQLARFTKDFYENIHEIQPYNDLKRLIQHNDSVIRSRVLNLIGNLCRHSNFFYQILIKYDLLKQCIKLLEDSDKTTRKFACVAVGNAGFHDDSLYEYLKPAIPVLVQLLKDQQEKTRSNAAAALGNFVRNSNYLDHEFIKSGAIYQLVNVIRTDKTISAKKIALMGINNLMSLPESSQLLLNLEIKSIVSKFIPPIFSGDQGIIKTATKILDKINNIH